MSEGEGTMVDKSESSSFEDLASAAIAEEVEEAKLAEAAATEKEKEKSKDDGPKPDEWQDLLGSGALLKKVSNKLYFVNKDLSYQKSGLCLRFLFCPSS